MYIPKDDSVFPFVIHFLIILIAALGWPVSAFVRRRFKQDRALDGRPLQLHRAVRVTAWLYLLLAVGWVLVLKAVDDDLSALNGGLDPWIRLLQLVRA